MITVMTRNKIAPFEMIQTTKSNDGKISKKFITSSYSLLVFAKELF